MVVASDFAKLEADEALPATMIAMAHGRSAILVAQSDGCKLTKDGPVRVDDERPRLPRSVAQGRLKLGPLNGNEAKHFRAT